MRRLARGEAFVDAMGDIAKWGDVTLIVHTDDGIMEFTGRSAATKSERLKSNQLAAFRALADRLCQG